MSCKVTFHYSEDVARDQHYEAATCVCGWQSTQCLVNEIRAYAEFEYRFRMVREVATHFYQFQPRTVLMAIRSPYDSPELASLLEHEEREKELIRLQQAAKHMKGALGKSSPIITSIRVFQTSVPRFTMGERVVVNMYGQVEPMGPGNKQRPEIGSALCKNPDGTVTVALDVGY